MLPISLLNDKSDYCTFTTTTIAIDTSVKRRTPLPRSCSLRADPCAGFLDSRETRSAKHGARVSSRTRNKDHALAVSRVISPPSPLEHGSTPNVSLLAGYRIWKSASILNSEAGGGRLGGGILSECGGRGWVHGADPQCSHFSSAHLTD